jgi:hypothetical protein
MTVNNYKFVPFEAWHMDALRVTDSVDGFSAEVVDEYTAARLEQCNSWTLFNGEGYVIACGGTIEEWKGRHIAWVYNTQKASECMLKITRLVKQGVEPIKGRIEMTVRVDFEAGHRWAKLLGFEIENPPGILKQYGPLGEDHIAYVRIQ